MSPIAYLCNVRDAELVLTASIHYLAFAVIYNKPFVCFLSGNVGRDKRLAGLLNELGLENRAFQPEMTLADVSAPIDYVRVNDQLSHMVAESLECPAYDA